MYINVYNVYKICNISNRTFIYVGILVFCEGSRFSSHVKKGRWIMEHRCVLSSRVWMGTRVQGLCCITQQSCDLSYVVLR